MSKTGLIPGPVSSLDELLAVAHAMEQEAALRYRALPAHVQRQGNTGMAAQFKTLARAEDCHAIEVEGRSRALLGHAPNPTRHPCAGRELGA